MKWLIVLMAIAFGLVYYSKSKSKKLTAFGKEVVYLDDHRSKTDYPDVIRGELLTDTNMGIAGKPDYILKDKDGSYVPIEIKSGNIQGDEPYPGDKMQLAAYLVLAGNRFGQVKYGEIHYKNKQFTVLNTPELRVELKGVVKKMNEYKSSGEKPEALGYSPKCRFCDCRGTVCKVKDGNG